MPQLSQGTAAKAETCSVSRVLTNKLVISPVSEGVEVAVQGPHVVGAELAAQDLAEGLLQHRHLQCPLLSTLEWMALWPSTREPSTARCPTG